LLIERVMVCVIGGHLGGHDSGESRLIWAARSQRAEVADHQVLFGEKRRAPPGGSSRTPL
jgi:hypothetical protein